MTGLSAQIKFAIFYSQKGLPVEVVHMEGGAGGGRGDAGLSKPANLRIPRNVFSFPLPTFFRPPPLASYNSCRKHESTDSAVVYEGPQRPDQLCNIFILKATTCRGCLQGGRGDAGPSEPANLRIPRNVFSFPLPTFFRPTPMVTPPNALIL
jgi:hypothetical protein